ncbi:LysR family transcriptional regulator [Vagococcus intermedius]|uniref:LysR family transcriptional regulator n=1 Tax=Vagococcus intermedius TaxID=2991418 RepID=A0AAF0I874_9ENTE|nr:LysR family transcriptional regulator [Vagococcus intermedius]WEG73621.1 LysR family transcriptional regulator [Vagococcus intermedius]WEG75705.1 LysR family transcriptional regulator [Vagococcus intermedius]
MVGKLDLYRIFQVVSQNKSFSKAAKELYMTQSAISQSIAKLEFELEVSLFYRTPKGVFLTKEGEVLEEHVRAALNLIEIAEDKLLNFKEMKTGELKIGVGDTISRYFLMPYLESFYSEYPGIKLKIVNGTTPEIMVFLKEGEVDVGVCHLPIADERFDVRPCKEIQDIFVCSPDYPIAKEEPLSYAELLSYPLIFLEKKSNSRMYVDDFLAQQGHVISPIFELGSYDLVMEFAKINLGISCVLREFAESNLLNGELIELPLEQTIPSRHIGIIHLKSYPLSQAAQKFVESIIK